MHICQQSHQNSDDERIINVYYLAFTFYNKRFIFIFEKIYQYV